MRMGVLSRHEKGRFGGGREVLAPRNGGLVSVEFQGLIERRERRFDPEHVLFCSVLCSLVSLFFPSSIFPHLRGCLYALDRAIGLDVGDTATLVFPSQKRTTLPLRNRQRGSGKTRSRNQELPTRSEHGVSEETKWVLEERVEHASM